MGGGLSRFAREFRKPRRIRQHLVAGIHRLCGELLQALRFSYGQLRGGPRLIKRGHVWYVPLWLPIALAILLASSVIWDDIALLAQRGLSGAVHLLGANEDDLADLFTPSVQHWSEDIRRWARDNELDPQLLATVMQIESCGHPSAVSQAGAQGLFQVMPFHFADGEDMQDTETNAMRGGAFLKYCGTASGDVIGLTLACYNGGPSVISQDRERWPAETRKYYRWGVGIFSDAAAGKSHSDTLDQWLAAGGQHLCDSAWRELNP